MRNGIINWMIDFLVMFPFWYSTVSNTIVDEILFKVLPLRYWMWLSTKRYLFKHVHCTDNYWRLKKTNISLLMDNVSCMCVRKSARLFSKEAGVYSQARRATGRRMAASASRVYHRKSHLFHHFAIIAGLLPEAAAALSQRVLATTGTKLRPR